MHTRECCNPSVPSPYTLPSFRSTLNRAIPNGPKTVVMQKSTRRVMPFNNTNPEAASHPLHHHSGRQIRPTSFLVPLAGLKAPEYRCATDKPGPTCARSRPIRTSDTKMESWLAIDPGRLGVSQVSSFSGIRGGRTKISPHSTDAIACMDGKEARSRGLCLIGRDLKSCCCRVDGSIDSERDECVGL